MRTSTVEETIFEGLAAAYAAVLPEYRRQGIAVVDIGSQSTELVVYYGDAMYLASHVKVSGDHFTRDLAQGLCLSFEDAETVKREYGSALASSSAANAVVDLPTPESREYRHADAPLRQRDPAGARRGVVPLRALGTGSRGDGARAHRAAYFSPAGRRDCRSFWTSPSSVLQCQSRFGLPVGIGHWPETMDDPEWSVAAGLAMYSAKLKAQEQRATRGILGKLL